MTKALISRHKIETLSNAIFLIGLGILIWTGFLWPGILLLIWATLAFRQYFSGRMYDLTISSVLLLGILVLNVLNIRITAIGPVLLILGGLYIVFREFTFGKDSNGEEKSEEIRDDMDVND